MAAARPQVLCAQFILRPAGRSAVCSHLQAVVHAVGEEAVQLGPGVGPACNSHAERRGRQRVGRSWGGRQMLQSSGLTQCRRGSNHAIGR